MKFFINLPNIIDITTFALFNKKLSFHIKLIFEFILSRKLKLFIDSDESLFLKYFDQNHHQYKNPIT